MISAWSGELVWRLSQENAMPAQPGLTITPLQLEKEFIILQSTQTVREGNGTNKAD